MGHGQPLNVSAGLTRVARRTAARQAASPSAAMAAVVVRYVAGSTAGVSKSRLESARDMLVALMEQDHGKDWATWTKKISEWLASHPE